ncbi:hypothetical protein EVAR_75281_1 [Eumeta japonica]|uniref:Uncharacterized protein n=1 Tax=Eumeta variegata TaxID=151549 RepID=A0A4C1V879_EUMVA|nr:hypothetical protein EVAR_75281_1 [Eumeta japonica]
MGNARAAAQEYCLRFPGGLHQTIVSLSTFIIDQPLRTVTVQLDGRVLEEIFQDSTTITTRFYHSLGIPKSNVFGRDDRQFRNEIQAPSMAATRRAPCAFYIRRNDGIRDDLLMTYKSTLKPASTTPPPKKVP